MHLARGISGHPSPRLLIHTADTMGKTSNALSGDEDSAKGRRESLASRTQMVVDTRTFQRLMRENGPEIDHCRQILKKPPGKRTLDDIHMVRQTRWVPRDFTNA